MRLFASLATMLFTAAILAVCIAGLIVR